jgi:hypothetical protein
MTHTPTTATPTILVAIGRQAQQFHAVVTTAPPPLDAPATLTLYDATLADVAGLAASPPVLHQERADARARLVLVEATEFAWQRARWREGHHLFTAADPVLVNLNTLQRWLWYRLRAGCGDVASLAPSSNEASANAQPTN